MTRPMFMRMKLTTEMNWMSISHQGAIHSLISLYS